MAHNVPRLCDVGRSAAKANVPKAEERSDEAHSLCYVPLARAFHKNSSPPFFAGFQQDVENPLTLLK